MRRTAGNRTELALVGGLMPSSGSGGSDEDDASAGGVRGDVAGTTTPSEEAEAQAPEGSIASATLIAVRAAPGTAAPAGPARARAALTVAS